MSRLEVGRIAKPHGLRGEVVVVLTSDRAERGAPGSVWYTADGQRLVVAASRPHQDRLLVFLEGLTSREDVDHLRGAPIFADAIDDPDALWVHELVGKTVVEVDGTDRGKVVSVLANPASDLLELASGSLVPLVFLAETRGDTLIIDPPDGLFELDDA